MSLENEIKELRLAITAMTSDDKLSPSHRADVDQLAKTERELHDLRSLYEAAQVEIATLKARLGEQEKAPAPKDGNGSTAVTVEDLQGALRQLVEHTGSSARVSEILHQFGADRLAELDPTHYGSVLSIAQQEGAAS